MNNFILIEPTVDIRIRGCQNSHIRIRIRGCGKSDIRPASLLIIHFLVFEHISRRAKIDFYPPQVVSEGQKSIIGYSKRLPKTSNRIKII